jgi:hypothetical protein
VVVTAGRFKKSRAALLRTLHGAVVVQFLLNAVQPRRTGLLRIQAV